MTSMDSTTRPADEQLTEPQSDLRPTYSLGQITRYALYLGTFGFGGPVALVGYMHRDLVEAQVDYGG